jgi:hypothetical protein
MVTTVGKLFSGIFSRWTLLIAAGVVLAWNIHLRVDHLSIPSLQGSTISASSSNDSLSAP